MSSIALKKSSSILIELWEPRGSKATRSTTAPSAALENKHFSSTVDSFLPLLPPCDSFLPLFPISPPLVRPFSLFFNRWRGPMTRGRRSQRHHRPMKSRRGIRHVVRTPHHISDPGSEEFERQWRIRSWTTIQLQVTASVSHDSLFNESDWLWFLLISTVNHFSGLA